MTKTARPGGRALRASEPMGAGRPSVPPLRFKRIALIIRTVPLIHHASRDTFPQGKALRAADSRPYGKSESVPSFRRGRIVASPSRSFCHSGAHPHPPRFARHLSLPPLAFGHFPLTGGIGPLEGGRLSGDRKGRPYGFTGALPEIWRAGEDTRPYGESGSVPSIRRGRSQTGPPVNG